VSFWILVNHDAVVGMPHGEKISLLGRSEGPLFSAPSALHEVRS